MKRKLGFYQFQEFNKIEIEILQFRDASNLHYEKFLIC